MAYYDPMDRVLEQEYAIQDEMEADRDYYDQLYASDDDDRDDDRDRYDDHLPPYYYRDDSDDDAEPQAAPEPKAEPEPEPEPELLTGSDFWWGRDSTAAPRDAYDALPDVNLATLKPSRARVIREFDRLTLLLIRNEFPLPTADADRKVLDQLDSELEKKSTELARIKKGAWGRRANATLKELQHRIGELTTLRTECSKKVESIELLNNTIATLKKLNTKLTNMQKSGASIVEQNVCRTQMREASAALPRGRRGIVELLVFDQDFDSIGAAIEQLGSKAGSEHPAMQLYQTWAAVRRFVGHFLQHPEESSIAALKEQRGKAKEQLRVVLEAGLTSERLRDSTVSRDGLLAGVEWYLDAIEGEKWSGETELDASTFAC